LTLKYCSN